MSSNNKVKINLSNKTGFAEIKSGAIFSNVYTVVFIFAIALFFLGIGIYYMYKNADELDIKVSSSFFGEDMLTYEPLFQKEVKNIVECVDICKNDLTCDGITFNADSKICSGTKKGLLRNESGSYSAWVKPSDFVPLDAAQENISKAILVGNTSTMKNIKAEKIKNPYLLGHFAYSVNILITDFYKNYGHWRHIFHKGTPINPTTGVVYQSWENLVSELPTQVIGVWLAPFTNNIRIAITTQGEGNMNNGSYSDAFVQTCNEDGQCFTTDTPGNKWNIRNRMGDGSVATPRLETYVEYFDQDLQNIPVNKLFNLTVNFRGRDAEVFINGKIVKIIRLDGVPILDKSDLYIMNEKTIGGQITNLIYYPEALKLPSIKEIRDMSQLID